MRALVIIFLLAVASCHAQPEQRDIDFNSSAVEENAAQDALYAKVRAKNGERAKGMNKRAREIYGRAKQACDSFTSKGYSSPQCPPKPPVCFDETGTLQEVPC